MNLIKAAKKYLYEDSPLSKMESYAAEPRPFMMAELLVRIYYFFLLYSSVALISSWDLSLAPQTGISSSSIWSVNWLQYVSFPLAMIAIRLSFIVTSLAATLAPQLRLVRILSFVALFEFVSLYFSVLQLDVDWYTMLLASFLLIFLPSNWDTGSSSPVFRQKFLLVFWGSQAVVFLTYSMAGIGKLAGGVSQLISGKSFFLEPKASVLQITDRLIVTDSASLFTPGAVDFYILMWPFFVGTVYLLLFSFIAAFRPNLHRIWGFFLILFHISNYLFINIGFSAHIFLLSLLFLASPFAPQAVSWREILDDLPIFGWIIRSFRKKYA